MNPYELTEKEEIIRDAIIKLMEVQKEIPPEYEKIIFEDFWELV